MPLFFASLKAVGLGFEDGDAESWSWSLSGLLGKKGSRQARNAKRKTKSAKEEESQGYVYPKSGRRGPLQVMPCSRNKVRGMELPPTPPTILLSLPDRQA